MGEVEELRKELDELDKEREKLKEKLRELGIKKAVAHIKLMLTPEMKKAYKKAYRKVRYGWENEPEAGQSQKR